MGGYRVRPRCRNLEGSGSVTAFHRIFGYSPRPSTRVPYDSTRVHGSSIQAPCLRCVCVHAPQASQDRSGRFREWVKEQTRVRPAVRREAEEDLGMRYVVEVHRKHGAGLAESGPLDGSPPKRGDKIKIRNERQDIAAIVVTVKQAQAQFYLVEAWEF
jgi:hypothetical protein